MRSVDKLLFDIADSARIAVEFSKGMDRAAFDADTKTQDAVIRRLMIIGGAAKNLPETWRDQHTTIPWRQTSRMRDRLIHNYFEVNEDTVWEVLTVELPKLIAYVHPMVTPLLAEDEDAENA